MGNQTKLAAERKRVQRLAAQKHVPDLVIELEADVVQGVQVYRPFVFGSIAELLLPPGDPDRDPKLPPDHTHRWTVYVRGVDGADVTHWLKKVSFKLHESFAVATRTIESPERFEVTETGWGEFEITIKLFFVPEANEKPMSIYHFLKLHPYGDDAEEVREKKLPVRSETYTEIVFVEPFEPFFDVLTGGGATAVTAAAAQKGGKGKAAKTKLQQAQLDKEADRRTAEIPMKGTPFSHQTEELELERLAGAQKKVQDMLQKQLKVNLEKEAELNSLKEELNMPLPKKAK